MKISKIITDKYKLRIPPTVYYDLLADVQEAEEELMVAIDNSISLPDNATNGDVIKAIFPDCERESRLNEECIEVMGAYRVVDRSWWNAPYKVRK